jgi:hypothetical protein
MPGFEHQQNPTQSNEPVRAVRTDQGASRPLRADNPVLTQQRALGNQAVQRLLLTGALQAKLRVGQPSDVHEQEADRVANTVMRMPEPEVQRQRTEEEETPRAEPLAEGISPLVQRQTEAPPEEEEEEPPQAEAAPGQVQALVQRQEAEPAKEEEEEEEPQAVQRKAKGADITHVRNAAQVQRLRSPSGGSPLSSGVRSFFERRFGYDFSEVRIHDTYRDRADAASLSARAFTYGKHIWLGDGESATDSRLMAHELTHVVQQDAAVRRQPLPATPVAPLIERERPWWERAKAAVGGAVSSVGESIVELGGALKERLLGKVTQWVKDIPGFDLLTVILGKDPITGKPVERNAITLTRGVLGLLGPPGLAMFENLEKAGAITRAFEWLNVEISKLNLTWETIKELGQAAWKALDATDLINPAGGLAKLIQIFGQTLNRLVNFAFAAGQKILEFIFEGVLSLAGGFGPRVMAIVRRAGAIFSTIIKDPIKFLGNLITAIRGGFERFSDNILDHLRTGLLQWLLGALSGAGLTLPDKWDLKGFVSIIVQVLGLSYDKSVRPRLVKLIGERAVAFLEGVFDFVKTLVTGGLSAAWEKILEYAENLQEMVIGAIRDWVAKSVVGAAITKLVTMFNPVGAIIQGIMTIYNTIVFFIERAQQIAELVEAVFDSIANIAAGNLGAAINYVERTMARALPVIISFLARLIGLGDIAGQVRSFIERVQAMVDKAIGWVVDFIVKRVRGLVGGPDKRTPEQQAQDLDRGVSEAHQLLQDEKTTPAQVKAALPKIRKKYRLTSLELVTDSRTENIELDHIEGEINPKKGMPTVPKGPPPTLTLPIDLALHEDVAEPEQGHTLRWHISKNKAFLRKRLIDDVKPPRASTFIELSQANDAVNEVLGKKRPEVEAWLASTNVQHVIKNEPYTAAGWGIERPGFGVQDPVRINAQPEVRMHKVRLIIRKDKRVPWSWYVVTFFPDI